MAVSILQFPRRNLLIIGPFPHYECLICFHQKYPFQSINSQSCIHLPQNGCIIGGDVPPRPTWTEKDMADQTGRVFLITGGSTGIGYKVAKTLYHLNGRVYITASTLGSVEKAVNSIHESSPHPS